MRHCLLLSGALALVTSFTSTAAIRFGGEHHHQVGFHTVIHRTGTLESARCTVLDKGETQHHRDLSPGATQPYRVTIRPRQIVGIHDAGHQSRLAALGIEQELDELIEIDSNRLGLLNQKTNAMLQDFCQTVEWMLDVRGEEGTVAASANRDESQVVFDTPENTTGSDSSEDEVRQLIKSGPPKNRVDIVFMGDGFAKNEREKFFTDVQRLTDDMFNGETFQSYLPLFNIWAIYRESKESGIGTGGKWKDTAFKLYRDGTELRGIYTADPRAARQACKLTGQYACDYPSLIGNDPYYGGLGGEFSISTTSNKSGTIVLRHEMFHSMGDSGDEYDYGTYMGCNAERWSYKNPKWKHWLADTVPREEQSAMVAQDYSWYNLANGPYRVPFVSSGTWSRWGLKISHSGVDTDDAMEVFLDGEPLAWKSPGGFDRDFSEWFGEQGFSKGPHELEFRQGKIYDGMEEQDRPIRQLCSVTLHEFAGEDLYRFDNNIISAYPTFDTRHRRTWRPSNEGCLMRNMTSTHLCVVCQEGLWQKLLAKVSLLDEVEVRCSNENSLPQNQPRTTFNIEATLVPLGQFRTDQSKRSKDESYNIQWFRNGEYLPEYEDQVRILDAPEGLWEIKVEFRTAEVRMDPRGLLKARKIFTVSKHFC